MIEHRYIVVSGYHANPGRGADWFHQLWWNNLNKWARPERVFIIASGNSVATAGHGEWIALPGNLGGAGALLGADKPRYVTGCAAVWMIGAWLAYANECDFVYLEQDALAFGPWIERMYGELCHRKMIIGPNSVFGASTSLFLVRHDFIPEFTLSFLGQGPGNIPSRLSERKFARMAELMPESVCYYSFGFDRERPYRLTDHVFYLQKLTPNELVELRVADLISLDGMPDNVPVFSNH